MFLLLPPHPFTTPGPGTEQISPPPLGCWQGQPSDPAYNVLLQVFTGSFPAFLGGGRSRDLPGWDALSGSLGPWEDIQWLCRRSSKPPLPVTRFKTGQNLRDSWAINGNWINCEALKDPHSINYVSEGLAAYLESLVESRKGEETPP